MKDKQQQQRQQHKTITVGMRSPLSPGYGSLAFDPFSDDDGSAFVIADENNNNNNNSKDFIYYDEADMDISGRPSYNWSEYNVYTTSTFPRRRSARAKMDTSKSTATMMKDANAKARLPVFKLLHVNRRKAEIIASMPDDGKWFILLVPL